MIPLPPYTSIPVFLSTNIVEAIYQHFIEESPLNRMKSSSLEGVVDDYG